MQGSDLKSSQTTWGICGKSKIHYVLALIVIVGAGGPMVTGQDGSRIQGGEVPPAGKYPALARLIRRYDTFNLTVCVVLIVNRDWVVCAATCVVNYYGPVEKTKLTIIVGDEIINETEPYEREHEIQRYVVHHRFKKSLGGINEVKGDNIAVMKVTPPIMFSNRVSPCNLPTCKEPVTGTGLVAGYGRDKDLIPNDRLTEITTKIISLEECYELTRRRYDDRVFCVAGINSTSTCFFDDGAPLYHVKNDNQRVLVGLMSTYPNKGQCGVGENVVSTYTRLSSYVGWIHRRIGGCGNHPWYNETDYDGPKTE